jgi:hypothetical protein
MRGKTEKEINHKTLVLNYLRRRGIVEKEVPGGDSESSCTDNESYMKNKCTWVEGKHKTHHRVFLIYGGRVVKDWNTDVYLERSLADLQRT